MDCIVTEARTLDGNLVDIEIRAGAIDTVTEHGDGDPEAFDPDRRYSADGRLVTPSLTEPHIHLDTALTAGEPTWNSSGSLSEGIDIWGERKDGLTGADVEERASETVRWLVSRGVTRVRTHVDVTEPSLTGLEAIVDLRSDLSDLIDIQVVAFPQDGLLTDETHEDLLREAIEAGADVVGGIPHQEYTREDGVESVHLAVDVADRFDCPLDLHIDETDDPQSRFTEVLAAASRRHGLDHRTTASHATAMHSYSNAYAEKLVSLLASCEMNVVTNPSSNAVLQGRYDTYPRRRGHTRVEELADSGVTVGIGQDSIVDPWYHYGNGDPLFEAFVLLHFAHLNGYDDVTTLWEMLLAGNAEVFGVDDYGLREGAEGSLVVFDGTNPFDVLRTQAARLLVIKEGRVVARTEPAETTVTHDGTEHTVDFER